MPGIADLPPATPYGRALDAHSWDELLAAVINPSALYGDIVPQVSHSQFYAELSQAIGRKAASLLDLLEARHDQVN